MAGRYARKQMAGIRSRFGDEGQVTIFVVIAMAIFLIGFVGFAVDMTNLWFHRQMAQGAADAACQAGAMNLYHYALGNPTSYENWIPASPGSPPIPCTPGTSDPTPGVASPGPSPCRYAALNGYNSGGIVGGAGSNEVSISFPPDVAGVTPPSGYGNIPFIRVDVVDRVRLFFSPLITANTTQDVRAYAVCGLALAETPIPIIVLNPVCSHAMEVSGSGLVRVIGGPNQSVQVNSDSSFAPGPPDCATATIAADPQCSGNAAIDLSQGGENFTGSLFGTNGGQLPAPPGFLAGTTGSWAQHGVIPDPYRNVPPPDRPATVRSTFDHLDGYGTHGCPDRVRNGGQCRHYLPGLYDQPIEVDGWTAIFSPGIYYIEPAAPLVRGCAGVAKACTDRPSVGGQCNFSFYVTTGGVVRPATDGDGTGGVMFYLSGQGGNYGSAFFDSNAGKYNPGEVDDYYPDGSIPTSVPYLICPGATPPDTRALVLSQPLVGNVILGMCTEFGSYPNPPPNPNGWNDQVGGFRGFIFFQDRANANPRGQPMFQGGGGLLLAGTMYFHNCPASPACQPYNTDWNASLDLRGTPGSDTRVLGNIITDQFILGGTADVNMALDPNFKIPLLKVTMYR